MIAIKVPARSVLGDGVTTDFATASDGTRICWTSQGSGPAILLAMGATLTKEYWFRVAPVLAQHHRVLTFDNRGVGQTVWDGRPFTIQTLAADAMTVLDAAGEQRAHIYGVSLGGGTAQEIALSYPDRVISLILGCTTCKDEVTVPARRSAWVRFIPWRLLARVSAQRLYAPGLDPRKLREDRRVLERMRVTWDGLQAQAAAVAAYTSTDRLGRIRVPTLVIHGTADKAVPYEAGVRLASLISGAKLITLEGAGHGYTTDATEKANRAVLEFLATIDQ
jgi:pimeloyl-ACP methyl ester carboxylesterase